MATDKKVVLITGCSSGIGESFAKIMYEQGYDVWASARRLETIQGLKDKGINTVKLDVTDGASIKTCVATVLQESGKIDILINNAGISYEGPLAVIDIDQFRAMFETNVTGCIHMVQAVSPSMLERRSGTIINISSCAGFVGLPYKGTYAATKSALNTLSDALRLEMKPWGVDVICVCPGYVKSSILQNHDPSLEVWANNKLWSPFLRFFKSEPMTIRQPTDDWVKAVLKKIEKKPRQVFHGPSSTLVKYVARFAPYWVLDFILARRTKLNLPLAKILEEK